MVRVGRSVTTTARALLLMQLNEMAVVTASANAAPIGVRLVPRVWSAFSRRWMPVFPQAAIISAAHAGFYAVTAKTEAAAAAKANGGWDWPMADAASGSICVQQ